MEPIASRALYYRAMATRLLLGLCALLTLGACGRSHLTDSEIEQACDLVVRCDATADRMACTTQLDMTRNQAAMLGCSSEFASLARCFLRADSCTTPPECAEAQRTLKREPFAKRFGEAAARLFSPML